MDEDFHVSGGRLVQVSLDWTLVISAEPTTEKPDHQRDFQSVVVADARNRTGL